MKPLGRLVLVGAFLVCVSAAGARSGAAATDASSVAATGSQADDVQRLADLIDEIISKRWKAEKVVPAPAVDDAAFIRRVSLDIAGKIPAVSDLHEFLDDPSPD